MWDEDYLYAAARFTCTNCGNRTGWIDAEVSHSEPQADGTTIHTATVEFQGNTYQDVKTEGGSVVINLTYQDSTEGTEISWKKVDGAKKYEVYSVIDGEANSLGVVKGTTFTDSKSEDRKLLMGEIYTYCVVANDVNDVELATSGDDDHLYNPFEDVPNDSEAFEHVAWAYNSGLVNGNSKTTFNPDGHTSRVNFVMILWKMNGSPIVKGTNPFKDVIGSKKIKAILWAYKSGIVKGTSKTTFSPDQDLSRGNIIMLLWKMAGSPVVEGENPFTDVSGAKTVNSILWALENELCEGVSDTEFNLNGACSRGQFVEILHKYNEIYHVMG